MDFALSNTPIRPDELRRRMLTASAGAFNAYEGWVRDHNEGKAVTHLEYHGYEALAPSVAEAVAEEARAKYAIIDIGIHHRVGRLGVGEIAVWIGVTAHHRDASFLACRYLIDNIKYRLPVWKKEIYTDGSSAWIENHRCGCADPANLAHLPGAEHHHPHEQEAHQH